MQAGPPGGVLSPHRAPPAQNGSGGSGGRAPRGASGAAGASGALDTLAQPCQNGPEGGRSKLWLRAQAKHASVALAIGLAELRSELEKAYRNTYYCAGVLEQHVDGRITGKYCGNRWCLVCNRIRTARAMLDYLPVLQSWQDPHFVTLTIPNVPGDMLASTIADILTAITAIGRGISRTDGLSFRALRKLECTYNPLTGLYHPHFHLIVDGAPVATRIIDRWLRKFPAASRKAQHMRPADEGSLKELFKYFTKLSVNTSPNERHRIPLFALDLIFQAMRKKRVYQSMGFTLPRPDDSAEEGPIITDSVTQAASRRGEYIRWEWAQGLADWVDYTTGDVLSGMENSRPSGHVSLRFLVCGHTPQSPLLGHDLGEGRWYPTPRA